MKASGAVRFAPPLFAVVAAMGCGSSTDDAASSQENVTIGEVQSNGIALGPDGLPVGADGKPLPTKLDGRYELSNSFDLTSTGVFPNVANDTLKALSNFKEHPSQTIVDLLEAARVPLVGQVLNSIPSFIRDHVLEYIDDHLVKSLYQSVPFAKHLTSMLDDLGSITTKFELVTNLDLPAGDGIGNARASHTLSGVAYEWQGKRTFIGAPDVLRSIEKEAVFANAVALEKRSPALETGRLNLGDHTFTVPIGSFAIVAADRLVKDKLGAVNLRAALGKIVNCDVLADVVSKRCVDPPGPGKVCVDHKSELKHLCEVGLDAVVENVQKQIKRLDLPLLHMKDGMARMWDAPANKGLLDATVDRIDHGFWTATVNVNKQERTILATFVGRRIGDVASPSR